MNLIKPRANVYDIRSLKKLPDFKFFLDTNILKFVFAPTVANTSTYQSTFYPQFYKKLLLANAIKFTFTQNILELISIMDWAEAEIHGIRRIKEYRVNNLSQYFADRKLIIDEINSKISVLQTEIKINHIMSYFKLGYSIDIKDYIYILLVQGSDVGFVTDDAEFVNVEGINVFTANEHAIQAAKCVGKLMTI